uniref:Uncharacterized protein n=1 Tax=Octopus bimaculoides TaxID=37653 RepID=A0A0L8H9V6_OCTBM
MVRRDGTVPHKDPLVMNLQTFSQNRRRKWYNQRIQELTSNVPQLVIQIPVL